MLLVNWRSVSEYGKKKIKKVNKKWVEKLGWKKEDMRMKWMIKYIE